MKSRPEWRIELVIGLLAMIILALLLSACARDTPETIKPSVSALVPPSQQVCPDGSPPPPSPKPPRTIPQITDWGVGVFNAWYRTELARQECARRLTKLNQWIGEHLAPTIP